MMRSALALLGLAAALAAAPAAADCAPGFQPAARAMLDEMTRTEGFLGVVLVAVNGQEVLVDASGPANREWNIANTGTTRFRIGSMTKPFTAIAILQLAEQGKLSLDDPLSKHYPAAPTEWADVTIRQLLTHTSGVPDFLSVAAFHQAGPGRPHTPEELVRYVRELPLDFVPGEGWRYSNTGFILLGMVIERASGQTYGDYLTDYIFTPTGMTASGYETANAIIPESASGYVGTAEGWLNAPFLDPSNAYAAGAVYSTVGDLLKWDAALTAGDLLSSTSQVAMFADHHNHYGLGWQIDRKWDRIRQMHGGATPGFQSSFQRYPEAGVTVVALSNSEWGAAEKLATDLAGLCLGEQPYPAEVSVPAEVLDRYVGVYRLDETTVVMRREDGRLTMRFGAQPPSVLYAAGDNAFFQKTADATMTFTPYAQGQITEMVVLQNGQTYRFARVR